MTNMEVANTIAQQLGNGYNRIRAMTGAKQFVALDQGLMFRFPNGKGPNSVTIRLTPSDEYTMVFHRIVGTKVKVVEEFSGIHAPDLKTTFEKTTGLYLSL